MSLTDLGDLLAAWGVGRGADVGLAVGAAGVAVAVAGREPVCVDGDPAGLVGTADRTLRPRWVIWSSATATRLLQAGAAEAPAVSWDLQAVHAMLTGEWRAGPDRVWAAANGHEPPARRRSGPPDLFSQPADDVDDASPLRAGGALNPAWLDGQAESEPSSLGTWAGLAITAAAAQRTAIAELADRPHAPAMARAESTAELLCAELAHDGLPMQRAAVEAIVAAFVGERPSNDVDAVRQQTERDEAVLRHAPKGSRFLLRNPDQVKALLRACGIEVANTRAWTLESIADPPPVVTDLLAWRKSERIATTFGYRWLDGQLGDDERLRGDWTASDGAAGRMTASAGLHNMPAELRSAVIAEPGHIFVRADLGQVEPRVLAAVSGDVALARAADAEDLYLPVARDLGVDRATAKVAVLGAMYGQTTGHGAAALRGLDAAYPVAMAFLHAAAVAGQVGTDLRTWGGRLVRLSAAGDAVLDDRSARTRAAGRGRYARNAMIQGAAAELFKVWATIVRARTRALDARIVLCLHDELLVHAPIDRACDVETVVVAALGEAAARWAAGATVRFTADVSAIGRWSDAK